MTTSELYDRLNTVNSSRENRLKHASFILKNPELTPKLLEIVFKVEDKNSCKAAWVLEIMCNQSAGFKAKTKHIINKIKVS